MAWTAARCSRNVFVLVVSHHRRKGQRLPRVTSAFGHHRVILGSGACGDDEQEDESEDEDAWSLCHDGHDRRETWTGPGRRAGPPARSVRPSSDPFQRSGGSPGALASSGWLYSAAIVQTASMLTLFDDVFSPYARKVRIALYEKGVPFERVRALHGTPPDGLRLREPAGRGAGACRGRLRALRLDGHLRSPSRSRVTRAPPSTRPTLASVPSPSCVEALQADTQLDAAMFRGHAGGVRASGK